MKMNKHDFRQIILDALGDKLYEMMEETMMEITELLYECDANYTNERYEWKEEYREKIENLLLKLHDIRVDIPNEFFKRFDTSDLKDEDGTITVRSILTLETPEAIHKFFDSFYLDKLTYFGKEFEREEDPTCYDEWLENLTEYEDFLDVLNTIPKMQGKVEFAKQLQIAHYKGESEGIRKWLKI